MKHKTHLITMLVLLMSAGCATVVHNPAPVASISDAATSEDRYFLQGGDTIDVKAYVGTALDHEETLVVRPDGRVRLAILEKELDVGGREPFVVSQLIEEEYKKFYQDPPRVSVNVATFAPRNIYVGGEVGQPAAIPYTGTNMNVLKAITAAGYMNANAEPANIIVIRSQGRKKTPLAFSLQIDKAISNEDPAQNLALMPEDIVVVPLSQIAEVNKWVDLYIRKNIPTETTGMFLLFGGGGGGL